MFVCVWGFQKILQVSRGTASCSSTGPQDCELGEWVAWRFFGRWLGEGWLSQTSRNTHVLCVTFIHILYRYNVDSCDFHIASVWWFFTTSKISSFWHPGYGETVRACLGKYPDCGKWQWPTKSTDAEKICFPLAPFWSWLSCVITRGYNPFPSICIFQVERTGCLVRLLLFLRCGTQRLDQGPGTNTTPTFPVLVDFFPAYPWSPQPKGKCGRW